MRAIILFTRQFILVSKKVDWWLQFWCGGSCGKCGNLVLAQYCPEPRFWSARKRSPYSRSHETLFLARKYSPVKVLVWPSKQEACLHMRAVVGLRPSPTGDAPQLFPVSDCGLEFFGCVCSQLICWSLKLLQEVPTIQTNSNFSSQREQKKKL